MRAGARLDDRDEDVEELTKATARRYGDGFQQGGPDGEDPLLLARHMATQGISLVCANQTSVLQ